MPPPHDDIADAYSLGSGATTGSTTLDTVGATFETNEAGVTNYPGIWLTLDLSALVGTGDSVYMDLTVDGLTNGIAPYVQTYWDTGTSFNPAAPDFTLLTNGGFSFDQFYGDGTGSPGEKTLSWNPDADANASGIYYFWAGDWAFSTQGELGISWEPGTAPPPPPAPPTVVTGAATPSNSTGLLHGTVNPNNLPITNWHFEYGTTISYSHSTPPKTLPSGHTAVAVVKLIDELDPSTLYHYRLVAVNDFSMGGGTTFGADQTFTTDAYPSPPANDDIT